MERIRIINFLRLYSLFYFQVELLDCSKGMWNCKLSCIVLEFPSVKDANFWLMCAPDVKQPDWLGGIDIVIIPGRVTTGMFLHSPAY